MDTLSIVPDPYRLKPLRLQCCRAPVVKPKARKHGAFKTSHYFIFFYLLSSFPSRISLCIYLSIIYCCSFSILS